MGKRREKLNYALSINCSRIDGFRACLGLPSRFVETENTKEEREREREIC